MESCASKGILSLKESQWKKSKKKGINPHAVRRTPWKQLKQKFLVDASCNILNSKTAVPNVDSTHSTSNDQPLTMAHIQGREVDIGVMSELNCALDQKEAILTERRNSNDNKLENRAFQEAYCNGFFCFT
ncbi:hypothetical protein V6N11_068972 [Hibiscus sabdariffa]|uniref:Uncharacterized protein n=1 Tax=Hibiscus sabdariffa TaxID=183260 RepID=A0ABR2PBB3_9ROSI